MVPIDLQTEVGSVLLRNNYVHNIGEKPVSGCGMSHCYRKSYATGEKITIQGFEIPKQIITVVLDASRLDKEKIIYYAIWDDNNQKYFSEEEIVVRGINIFSSGDLKKITEDFTGSGIEFRQRD